MLNLISVCMGYLFFFVTSATEPIDFYNNGKCYTIRLPEWSPNGKLFEDEICKPVTK